MTGRAKALTVILYIFILTHYTKISMTKKKKELIILVVIILILNVVLFVIGKSNISAVFNILVVLAALWIAFSERG